MNDPVVPARFGLLGPLRVWRGETAVDLGPLQQRVVWRCWRCKRVGR